MAEYIKIFLFFCYRFHFSYSMYIIHVFLKNLGVNEILSDNLILLWLFFYSESNVCNV